MKRMLVIFLLTVYMVSTTELSQLLKFPVLIEHYFQHKEHSPHITVSHFLALHYNHHLKGHLHRDDQGQEQKLPFISSSVLLFFCFVVTPPYFFEAREIHDALHLKKPLPHDDVFVKTRILSSIWQPPKYC